MISNAPRDWNTFSGLLDETADVARVDAWRNVLAASVTKLGWPAVVAAAAVQVATAADDHRTNLPWLLKAGGSLRLSTSLYTSV